MARTRKTKQSAAVSQNNSNRQNKRRKPLNVNVFAKDITPLTKNQKLVFDAWEKGQNLFIHGMPGTGKTFIGLYLALKDIFDENSPRQKVYIVRSLVPTREIGFMPGSHEDKSSLYQIPYKNMVREMFDLDSDDQYEILYGNLKTQETISFWSTSFVRGVTIDDAVILVDEIQNLSFHESASIITRAGLNTRVIFCGDTEQSDLAKITERNGILNFMKIVNAMESFDMVDFGIDDIVRSGLVKEFLIAKYHLGL